jgi:hypothetical protein
MYSMDIPGTVVVVTEEVDVAVVVAGTVVVPPEPTDFYI